jgi:hypothetical protein
MMHSKRTLLGALLLLLLASGVAAAQTSRPLTSPEADYDLSWWTVDGGGGRISGDSYALGGTIGQPDAGPALSSNGYTLVGGFWYGVAAPEWYDVHLPVVLRRY